MDLFDIPVLRTLAEANNNLLRAAQIMQAEEDDRKAAELRRDLEDAGL